LNDFVPVADKHSFIRSSRIFLEIAEGPASIAMGKNVIYFFSYDAKFSFFVHSSSSQCRMGAIDKI